MLLGLSLGLAAGISPGPLQALVMTTSLQRGFAGGWRVAVAPLLTDAPIVTLSVAVASQLSDTALRGLAIAGGAVLVAFGLKEVWAARHPVRDGTPAGRQDIWRGIAVNALSPHPWVFWATVGGPSLIKAWRDDPVFGVGFVAGFFIVLVGVKLALAAFVAAARHRLSDGVRRVMLLAGGVILVGAGVALVVTEV